MILMRANQFRGPLEGMRPEKKIETFLGPEKGNERNECHLSTKSPDCVLKMYLRANVCRVGEEAL
jgi:hypothetical protein